MKPGILFAWAAIGLFALTTAHAQIGRRFPSEKKTVPDPVTGIPLTFLTSSAAGDSKIYPTHPQWTSDGKWVIFRSNRVRGEAMAVNEDGGVHQFQPGDLWSAGIVAGLFGWEGHLQTLAVACRISITLSRCRFPMSTTCPDRTAEIVSSTPS